MHSWHDREFISFCHYLHLLFTIRQEFFLTSEGMRDRFVSLISFQTYLYENANRQVTFRFAKKNRAGRIIVPVREHRPSGAVKWVRMVFPHPFNRVAIRAHSWAYGRTGARHLRSPGTGTRPGAYTWAGTATGRVAAPCVRRLRRKTLMTS